ncbi:PhzF family phenazine biosynthesis protein [Denitrobaculum tricleocarpae]|uniref:PhzF family phenazine biosynthesis protein n=1 Tax=Denitrobaculum tricleocarpae TaxID=2591009 RepID=A0A545TP57_9PROT|nr:PhzF family phenazine biosynthesis protein [Denitrobaculum tricleocarpae]TQV79005.1 PhzF family phenazine biosynthesis protein [Denitrobaculum tricleocarpae]
MPQRTVPYSIVDVFTTRRFAGNPVAVIRDARGLSGTQMQSIAQEFGFSETTFILPPGNGTTSAKLRIFTPFDEIPFAGHPNIGTAFVAATEETVAEVQSDQLVFDELGGPVSVGLQREQGRVIGARITAPQALEVQGECDTAMIAACLGLPEDQVLSTRFQPCVATVGLPFAFAELADERALAAVELNIAAFKTAQARGPLTVDGFAISAFAVTSESGSDFKVRARVFSPLGHPPEDPATGSAAGALTSLLALSGGDDGFCRASIEQGVEMGRPSLIEVEIPASGARAEITGRCVAVSSGVLYL